MSQSTFPRPEIPEDFDWNAAIARGRTEQAIAVHRALVWLRSALTGAGRADGRPAMKHHCGTDKALKA